jgi:hypothetical protein
MLDEDVGGFDDTYKDYSFNSSAALGLGVKILDPVYIDFVVNLENLTGAAAFRTLALATTVTAEF